MKNLLDISVWKKCFGHFSEHQEKDFKINRYVMLNGGLGNYCLDFEKNKLNEDEYYSKSWSSNTKNFVVVDKGKIIIYNWTKNKPEEIPKKDVADNFDKFYKYLSKNIKSERDVVPFIIDIFRQFRNITQEKTNPIDALNLLFVLLANLEEDYKTLDIKKWNVNKFQIPDGFDKLIERLKTGINNIKPELDLIIRHSAGVLFQEAQKEVLFFDPQRDLWGGISSHIETKNKLYSSIHYTPPYLARTIVENAILQVNLTKPKLKIFDPACGSSEFLIEALKQLKEIYYKGKVEIIGWDSSETAVNTSNFLLKYEQRTIWTEQTLNFQITKVEDSLIQKWDNDYDLILMNPPFVSWELLNSKDSRDAVRETLGKNFNGKPNQASAFFYKSIDSLKNDGVFGSVVPSSLLTLDAYKNLRNDVDNLITINLIGKLGNFVFEDALTDVSFIVGKKGKTNTIPTILWTRNEKYIAQNALQGFRKMSYSNEFTVNEKDYSVFQPTQFPIIKESWKPISLKENELLKTINRFVAENKLVRIETVFNVQQGIRQGVKDIFKISENAFTSLPENEKKYFRPVIDNESIKNGDLLLKNYIWYPYNKKGIILKTEKDLNKNAKHFYSSILKPQEIILTKRAGITEWWGLTRPRNWQYEKIPKLVSTEFGKSDSFAFDKEGVYVVERGNAWIPKKSFEEIDYYYFYLALFSSPFFDKLLSIYSKQLLSGWDLGKMFTKEIPIPNVHSSEVKNSDAYNKLVEIGKELSGGNSYVKAITDEILIKYFYPNS